MRTLPLIPLIAVFFGIFSSRSQAYPQFIGYGYSSCITCHYNGSGGGALSDYGRALFAGEISARDVYAKTTEDEEISARSGFLGKRQMPWWLRTGIKYRGMWLQSNPGSSDQKVERFINMQEDLNLDLFFNKKQTWSFISTYSYSDKYPPFESIQKWSGFLREYYLRWKINNKWWLYVGQLDKVYGIRDADHTAVNRKAITLGYYDQSQGVVAQITEPQWDLAMNLFLGNGYDLESNKQRGLSVSGEYLAGENWKIGASALSSTSGSTAWNLLGLHSRLGLSKGSAFLSEIGLKEKRLIGSALDSQLGMYVWLSSLVNLRRGYNLMANVELSKDDTKTSSDENYRVSFGGLFFPIPRTELRLLFVNGKSFSGESPSNDTWQLQSQLHVSY